METVEPIDYVTQDLAAGIRYADAARQFNVMAGLSVFRNRIEPAAQRAWRWTIDAVEGETARPFAAYTLTPTPCVAGTTD